MTATTLPSRLQWPTLRLPRLAFTHESMGVGALCALMFGSLLGAASGIADPRPVVAPPAPPVMAVRPLAPVQAALVNQAIPVSEAPNPAADPFRFKGTDAARADAIECLASAVYYEAGSESDDGERAVAQVVLNRVRHPAFPSSVCGVVYQGSTRITGCQFTFTCDGSLARRPDAVGWRRAKAVAEAALAGAVYAPVGWATHYHANYVVPYWAATLAKNAVVGAHLFYHWAGGWGRPAAFAQRYAGREVSAAALRTAALDVEAANPGLPTTAGTVAAIEALPGVDAIKLTPSMRGDKRVAIRFNQAGRKAADEAPNRDYAEDFKASDNLRWSLSEESAGAAQAPLGKIEPKPATGVGAGAGATALQQ